MRLRIAHRCIHRYDPPAAGAIQVLRLTPRNHEGQYVVRWRIDVTADTRLAARDDAFGNITHVFSADGPLTELTVEVDGEVETQNTNGLVRGTVERFVPSLFLRDTPHTRADDAIRDFAQAIHAEKGGDTLAKLHLLLDRLHAEVAHEAGDRQAAGTAAEAFARKRGSAEGSAHIFIGAAHAMGVPARYVAGYYREENGPADISTGHAWAEAMVPELGWIAFDPAHGFCPTDRHVRVAIGLDALGAAPVRGTRYGAGAETREVAIKVGQ